jgi:hypothetical protein
MPQGAAKAAPKIVALRVARERGEVLGFARRLRLVAQRKNTQIPTPYEPAAHSNKGADSTWRQKAITASVTFTT